MSTLQHPAAFRDDNDAILTAFTRVQRLRGLSRETIERTVCVVEAFARSLPPDRLLVSTTRADIEAWLMPRHIAPSTVNNYLALLSSFFKWLVIEEIADKDPTLGIVRPRRRRRLPRPISTDDLAFALQGADDRMRVWLALAAYQGLRCKEIAGIAAEDILWDQEPRLLMVTKTKGDRPRALPLHPEVEMALRVFGVPRSGYLFRRSTSWQHHRPDTISRAVNQYLRGLGIDATAHQLRHWFGTQIYGQTRDLRLTQELLGHQSPDTTAVYTKVVPAEEAVSAVANLHAGSRGMAAQRLF